MYMPNNDIQNSLFCKLQSLVEILDTQLYEPKNQNSLEVPKVVKSNRRVKIYNLPIWKEILLD